MQLKEAFQHGYWASRSPAFLQQDIVQNLLTLRSIPDTIFLIGVITLMVFSVKSLFHLRKPTHGEEEMLPVPDLSREE
jgi:nitric oxide reductase subunit B